MNMTEKEAETLDYIVKESLKKSSLFAIDLKSSDGKEDPISTDWDVLEKSYERYFNILKDNDVVNVERNGGRTRITPIPFKTKEFINQGGFTKQVNDELQRLETEKSKKELEIELALSNLEANKLNKSIAEKNRKNNIMNIIGFIINISIGILNAVLLLIQILKC